MLLAEKLPMELLLSRCEVLNDVAIYTNKNGWVPFLGTIRYFISAFIPGSIRLNKKHRRSPLLFARTLPC